MGTPKRSCAAWLLCGCLVAGTTGCNQTASDSADRADATATRGAAASSSGGSRHAPSARKPEAAVKDFLTAFRRHDEAAARAMLTPTARERTKEMDLNRDLQVSDKAAFTIGEVEVLADQGRAHVQCTWTDVDADSGEKYSSEMVWICQLEREGWRIKGLGIKVFPDAEGVILDYEDPDAMAATMEAIDQEIARRAEANLPDRQASRDDGAPDDQIAPRQASGSPRDQVRTASRTQRPDRDADLPAARQRTPLVDESDVQDEPVRPQRRAARELETDDDSLERGPARARRAAQGETRPRSVENPVRRTRVDDDRRTASPDDARPANPRRGFREVDDDLDQAPPKRGRVDR